MSIGHRRVEELVRGVALALHGAGLPAHRTEAETGRIADALGRPAQVFVTPTAVFVAFNDGGVQLLRANSGEVDLGRLMRVDEALRRVRTDDDDGVDALVAALDQPLEPASRLASVVAFSLIAASAVLFMGGGWLEAAWAVACGAVVGLVALVLERDPNTARLFVAAASVLSAMMAFGLAGWFAVSPERLTIAGLIVLVPGLSLTTALTELAQGHVMSGSARVASSGLTLLQMAVGVALGTALLEGLIPPPVPVPSGDIFGPWTMALAIVAGALSLRVLFRARWRDLPVFVVAGFVAVAGAQLGGALGGPVASAFVGALSIGVVAHGYARWLNRPVTTMLVPGVILLVPGSLGLTSVRAFLANDANAGVESAFAMGLTAAALVAGGMVAAVLLPPRKLV